MKTQKYKLKAEAKEEAERHLYQRYVETLTALFNSSSESRKDIFSDLEITIQKISKKIKK